MNILHRPTNLMSKPPDDRKQTIETGKAFIAENRRKMEQLLEEFAEGKLNRDQFHTLYERYQVQINSIKALLVEEDPSKWVEAIDGVATIDIRSRLLGKAIGILIYTNRTGTLLDKLGTVQIDPLMVSELLEKIARQPRNDAISPELVAQRPNADWLYVVKGDLTTIIMLFSREPTIDQKLTVLRLHKDFERANVFMLQRPRITPDELAMPFRVIVQRSGPPR